MIIRDLHYENSIFPLAALPFSGSRYDSINQPFSGLLQNPGSSNDDSAPKVTLTDDGNLIIVSNTTLNDDIVVTKTDLSGTVIWSQNYGTLGSEQAAGVVNDGAGGYLVAGFSDDFGPALINGYFMRLDANGNIQWVKNCGVSQLEEFLGLSAGPGGTAVAGGFSFNNGIDFFVTRIDTSGNLIWSRLVGGVNTAELGFNVLATSDGGALLYGATDQGVGSDDILVCKLDAAGSLSWTSLFGSTAQEIILDAVEVGDGYVLAGRTSWFGNADAVVMKLDTTGTEQWTQLIQTSGADQANRILQRTDGNLELLGRTDGAGFGFNDFFRVTLDPAGNVINSRVFGTSTADVLDHGTLLPDGSLVLVGTKDNNSSDELALVRVDSAGAAACLDTTFAFTVLDTAFVVSTPMGIVSNAAGTLQNKTHASTNYNWNDSTLCQVCNITIRFGRSDTLLCAGETLGLTDLSNTNSREWKLNGQSIGTTPFLQIVLQDSGTHFFTLVVENGPGCVDSVNFQVEVTPLPVALFSIAGSAGSYTFTDQSTGILAWWNWDFGDGTTSFTPNPAHIYAAPGDYVVCLEVVSWAGCTSIFCDTINFSVGIPEVFGDKLKIFPNPASTHLTLQWDPNAGPAPQKLELQELSGRVVRSFEAVAWANGKAVLDLRGLSGGLYFLRIETETASYTRKCWILPDLK